MCYDLSPDDGDTGESVLLSKLGSSEVVTFYSDSKCQNPVEKFSSDTCFNPLGYLGSFQVIHTDYTTKDIVATPVKLSNYRDLAVSSPYEIDLRFSDFFIGVSTLITSHGLSIFAAVVACSAINGPDPIPIAACIAVPLASVLAYVGHYFLKKAGQNAQSSIELRTGRFPGRSLENISDLNTQYMTSLIAGIETDNETYAAESVGFMSREADGVVHTSPIYELDTGAGGKWHFSAFFDPDSGTFIHHMHSAAETRLAKRSAPYDTILYVGKAVALTSVSAPSITGSLQMDTAGRT
ncbi:hypothetical protein KCU73_g5346, partial [Aureobasidium melanogenum]